MAQARPEFYATPSVAAAICEQGLLLDADRAAITALADLFGVTIAEDAPLTLQSKGEAAIRRAPDTLLVTLDPAEKITEQTLKIGVAGGILAMKHQTQGDRAEKIACAGIVASTLSGIGAACAAQSVAPLWVAGAGVAASLGVELYAIRWRDTSEAALPDLSAFASPIIVTQLPEGQDYCPVDDGV